MHKAAWRTSINEFLCSLSKHVGLDGFEGLAVVLLEEVTEQRFRLSRSGSQYGRDALSEPSLGNTVMVEAKHYSKSKLNLKGDLLPGLEEAVETPEVDLWILVASCAVPSQYAEELRGKGHNFGVDVLILDSGNDMLPRFPVLMASSPEIVERWLRDHDHGQKVGKVQSALSKLRHDPLFDRAARQLREDLNTITPGFDDSRKRINTRFLATLADDCSAKARFHQTVSVRAADAHVISRADSYSALRLWWESRGVSLRESVITGEEGSGKTWAAMHWLADLAEGGNAPIVLPFSAFGQPLASDESMISLLPKLLADWSGVRTAEFWGRRLNRWLASDAGPAPAILVFADGLNERPRLNWVRFLASLNAPNCVGKVAVLATDRREHWIYDCQSGLSSFDTISVGDYNDDELREAIAGRPITVEGVPQDMLPLIRRPRYCQLAIKYFDEMVQDDDFNVERLLYLDIRHRQSGQSSAPSEKQFQHILGRLAERYLEAGSLDRSDLREFDDPEGRIYQEVLDGLLVPKPGATVRYKVDTRRLVYGAGMLLCDQVLDSIAAGGGREELAELLARWFEPKDDIDLKARFCWAAIFHSVRIQDYPPVGRQELLKYWLGMRNWESSPEQTTQAARYVKKCPQDFVEIAEGFWAFNRDYGAAQDFFARAFLEHRDHERVEPVLVRAVGRWFGFVHPAGPALLRSDAHATTQRARIEARVGQTLAPGPLQFSGETLTVIADDTLFTLIRFGILIVSAGRRLPYIPSLARWALASAVMGGSTELAEMKWLIRLSEEDVETPLLQEAGRLIQMGEPTALTAGRTLLSVLGTASALALESTFPDPESEWARRKREAEAEDPCRGLFDSEWRDDLCQRCMARGDIHPLTMIEKLGDRVYNPQFPIPEPALRRIEALLDVDPHEIRASRSLTIQAGAVEKLQPVLGARSPRVLGDFIRSVVRTMPDRNPSAMYQLALWLSEVTPLLGQAEVASVLDGMSLLRVGAESWSTPDLTGPAGLNRQAESFAFSAILSRLDPRGAFDELLRRPSGAQYLARTGAAWPDVWFRPLSREDVLEVLSLIHSSNDATTLQRALWYLEASNPVLTGADRARLLSLANSDDSPTRTAAVRFACAVGDTELGYQMVNLGRSFRRLDLTWEAEAGINLLLRFSSHLSFQEIAARVPPAMLGKFLRARGNRDDEVQVILEILDRCWLAITEARGQPIQVVPPVVTRANVGEYGTELPALAPQTVGGFTWRSRSLRWGAGSSEQGQVPTFPATGAELTDVLNRRLREQADAIVAALQTGPMQWYGLRFGTKFLDRIYQQSPETVTRWIQPALGPGPVPAALFTFLVGLCHVLLERDPVLGLKLWSRLSDSAPEWLPFDRTQLALAVPDSTPVEEARAEVLAECYTDQSLAYVALAAERYKRTAWLQAAIERLTKDRALWKRAKGLTLASFSNVGLDGFERHVLESNIAGTWVEAQLPRLRSNVRKNRMAQHWYSVYCGSDDPDVAWGALQAMLACADMRFESWREAIEQTEEARSEWKDKFLAFNWSQFRQLIDKEKARGDTLFGIEITRGGVVPFHDREVFGRA